MARFYVTGQLGPQRRLTPEGFLVCVGVPIARTGTYEYDSSELGLTDSTGTVTIERDPDEVFSPVAMASFEGKPVTLDHPYDGCVDPQSWRRLAVGTVQNVRRGEGEQSDLLIADLMISDQRAIDLIDAGLREVSCGYDVETEYYDDSRGRQRNIIGNHVALVRCGRAGSRCAVGDTKSGGIGMDLERLKAVLLTALGFPPESGQVPGDNQKNEGDDDMAVRKDESGIEERLAALEGTVNQLVEALKSSAAPAADEEDPGKEEDPVVDEDEPKSEPTEDDDEEEKGELVGDKGKRIDSLVRARAAVLAPGMPTITTDSATGGEGRYMRRALAVALSDAATSETVKTFIGDKAVANLSDSEVKMAFVGASELVKERNNMALLKTHAALRDASAKPLDRIAQINEANKAFYGKN